MLPPPLPLTDAPETSALPLAVEIRGLTKGFGDKTAVNQLNLSVPCGQFYAFLGPNGAGKTTTLRLMSGLLKPDAGTIRLNGHDLITDPAAAKRTYAYVPDEPLLYGKLRPLEQLEFVAALWDVPPDVAAARGMALLEQLELADRTGDTLDSFSRGMKQRMALASALLHQPSLLLLDEPLTGLDARVARLVKDLLLSFVQEGGTVLLTTHILEVAERLSERIGIIDHGTLVAEGTLEELRTHTEQAGATLEDVFLRLVREPGAEPA
jgi:ABC-2 type transport system ATP-binding protein